MGHSNTVWPAGWWAEPSPACRGPSVRIASSSKVLAAALGPGGDPSGREAIRPALHRCRRTGLPAAPPALLLTALVMPWNDQGSRGAAKEADR